MARPDPASKDSKKKKERRQTYIRRTDRSEDDTPSIVKRPTSEVVLQSPTAREIAPTLSQHRLKAINPAPDLPENIQRTTLPPPAPMPVVRGRPSRDNLSAPQIRSPDWRDRLAVVGLAILVILMLAAMWRIMVG